MAKYKLGIGFLGAITLLGTMIVFHDLIYGHSVFHHLSFSSVVMMIVYVIIGLSIERHKGIFELVDRILYIQDNGGDDDAKLQLIKSFVRINVNKWVAYWHLYQEIVDGKDKKGRIGRIFKRMYNGSLSIAQFIWITAYMIFNIYRGHFDVFFMPHITLELQFIIDFIGLGFFIITSGDILGTKEFMKILFESIKPDDEKGVKETLDLLEANIIYGARNYGFLKREYCIVNGNEVKRNGV